ncbi:unnamed protein product [Mytilus edulis]|uniref:RING-type domain-containing protein n=1 Tax=Mytilus edulis TaxID=6550 RepID=A0A8S3R544_MYTED|nr:unnamed protein product [Mytilus edulis]
MELPDPQIYAPEVHTQQIRNNQLTSTPAHNMSPLAGPSMSPLAGPSMSPLAGPSMSSLAGPSNLQYTHRISPTQYVQPQSATPTQQSTSMSPASTPEDSLGARWINLDTLTMSVSRTFLQRSLAAEDQTRRCTLCDRQKNAVIIPCGHTFCMECATQVEALEQPCPMCRQEILDVNPFDG